MVGFGLFCLMGYRDRGEPVSDVLRNTVELVRVAEEAGFDAAWFAEHHFSNYCVCPSPLLMVNHCAAATSRIKLGPAVLVVPLYHPVRLLAEIGMTAALCGDRLLLGIGSGYQPFEFERYNVDLGQSKERLEEFLAIMDRAYAGETFAFEGAFTSIPQSCISTRPNVLPQIWIAGDSEATHRLAARRDFVPIITGRSHGADYLAEQRARIDASYAREGLGAVPHPLGVLRFCCVTESAAETRDYLVNARRQLRFATALRRRQEMTEGGMLIERPAENEASLEEMAENLAVGDMETVTERLIADIRASSASHIMLNIQTLGSTMEQARRSIEMFGREIRPRVERAIAATGPTLRQVR
ncbi:MAG: LLM class flavin-dependent oxidoreductase [Gammaproteobacteria bacterium]